MLLRLGCVACLLFSATPAVAANFWLSTTSDPNIGSAPPPDPNDVEMVNHLVGGPSLGSIFVWAQPDPNKTLANWSLRVISTDPSILSFTNSWVDSFNPWLGNTGPPNDDDIHRWEFVAEPNGFLDPNTNTHRINDFQGFSIFSVAQVGVGIGPQSTGTPYNDPLYDSSNDTWLLAQIDYTLTGVIGQTELFLQIGDQGLNNFSSDPNQLLEHSSLTSAVFGSVTDPNHNGHAHRMQNLPGDTADAFIAVIDAPPSADFDGNNIVNGLDLLIWQRGVGLADPNFADGDANNDGEVDGLDLAFWEQQYGGPPPISGLHAVPEPSSMLLLLLAISSIGLISWESRPQSGAHR